MNSFICTTVVLQCWDAGLFPVLSTSKILDPDTYMVKKNAIYYDKAQHANVWSKPLFPSWNNNNKNKHLNNNYPVKMKDPTPSPQCWTLLLTVSFLLLNTGSTWLSLSKTKLNQKDLITPIYTHTHTHTHTHAHAHTHTHTHTHIYHSELRQHKANSWYSQRVLQKIHH